MSIGTRVPRLIAACMVAALTACVETTPPPPPPPPPASVTVVNNSGLTINEVYIAPTTSGTWGANQISSPIYSGTSRTITSIPAGTYDLRAVASTGASAETYGVTLTAGANYTWTLTPVVGTLYVNNYSSYTIGYLYVVPYPDGFTYGAWGTDQLGTSTILPGYSFTLTSIPPDYYDMRAVSIGGTVTWTRYNQSIPAGGSFTWNLY